MSEYPSEYTNKPEEPNDLSIGKMAGEDLNLQKRFSKEQREALVKKGFVIYGLTGQSLKELKDSGRKIVSNYDKTILLLANVSSMNSEVAIDPERLYLPGSSGKTYFEQQEFIGKYSEELEKEVPGVKAIMGEAGDYIELAFRYQDRTRNSDKYLYGNQAARTMTGIGGYWGAIVGPYTTGRPGLYVWEWNLRQGNGTVNAAPLVVPS